MASEGILVRLLAAFVFWLLFMIAGAITALFSCGEMHQVILLDEQCSNSVGGVFLLFSYPAIIVFLIVTGRMEDRAHNKSAAPPSRSYRWALTRLSRFHNLPTRFPGFASNGFWNAFRMPFVTSRNKRGEP